MEAAFKLLIPVEVDANYTIQLPQALYNGLVSLYQQFQN